MSNTENSEFDKFFEQLNNTDKDIIKEYTKTINQESFNSEIFIPLGTKRIWCMYPELAQNYSEIVEKFKLFRNK